MPGLAISRKRARVPSRRAVAEWPSNDGLVLRAFADGARRWIDVDGVASYAFGAAGPVVAAAETSHEDLIRDTWIRSVLPLVVQARGLQVLHASAVRTASGGIAAFCGRTGAGKSTMAALLHDAGHDVVADDALGLRADDARVVAVPLPFRLRLRPAAAAFLGAIALEGATVPPAPLERILLLEPGDEPRVELVSPADAVGALMPHAYCFELEHGKEELVRTYVQLCSLVPVGRLVYPRSFERTPRTLDLVSTLLEAA